MLVEVLCEGFGARGAVFYGKAKVKEGVGCGELQGGDTAAPSALKTKGQSPAERGGSCERWPSSLSAGTP